MANQNLPGQQGQQNLPKQGSDVAQPGKPAIDKEKKEVAGKPAQPPYGGDKGTIHGDEHTTGGKVTPPDQTKMPDKHQQATPTKPGGRTER